MSRREEIRELYEGGVCQEQIAKRMQISPSTVSYHMRSLGYPAKPHKRYDWKAVQTFYDEGNSVRQCAAHFGFSLSAWGDAVNRRAVKARPRAMSVERLL
ncbi:MAG TPA: winged helix-turn-helix domain-containing protein, partial [Solirubrobacteraceae bacterium]|nr:winged helix-turn-helix domain-containing protein [Solirubrobacteraceae bacterium]